MKGGGAGGRAGGGMAWRSTRGRVFWKKGESLCRSIRPHSFFLVYRPSSVPKKAVRSCRTAATNITEIQ